MDEYRRHRGKARTIGLPFEVIGPDEIRRLHPLVETRGLLGAVWNPEDGHVDPTSVTQALVKGARDRGARIHRHTRVTGLERTAGRRVADRHRPRRLPRRGRRERRRDVGAGGRPAGRPRSPDRPDGAPVPGDRDHSRGRGARPRAAAPPRGRRLLLPPAGRRRDSSWAPTSAGPSRSAWAGSRPTSAPISCRRIRSGSATIVESAMARVPVLARAGIARIVNGPITYTPDGNPLLGPAFGLARLLAGLRRELRDHPGGRGRAVPGGVDHRRGSRPSTSGRWIRAATGRTRRSATRSPDASTSTRTSTRSCTRRTTAGPAGRPGRAPSTTASAPPARSSASGTAGSGRTGSRRRGRSRATGRASAGPTGSTRSARRRARSASARGCSSCRASRSTRSTGRARRPSSTGSARTGSRGSAGSRCPSSSRARGTIECDVTVTRLAPERFLVLSAAVAELHDLDWLLRHAPADGSVTIENVTARWGVLILAGPRARDVLGRVTDADLSNGAFPWLAAREIQVGVSARARAPDQLRGGARLGAPPSRRIPDRALRGPAERGRGLGLVDFGLRAMDSLRLEKALPRMGRRHQHRGDAARGRARALRGLRQGRLHRPGRTAAQRRDGVRKRLATLEVDALDADCWGNEAVWAGDRVVGITTSGGYAHWLGRSLAVAYLDAEVASPGHPAGRRDPGRPPPGGRP